MDFYIITYVYIFGFVFSRLSRRFLVMISMLFVKCSLKVPRKTNEDNTPIGYILHLILFFCIRNSYFIKKMSLKKFGCPQSGAPTIADFGKDQNNR